MSINAESTDWSPEESMAAVAFLEKIAYCQDQGKGMPGPVFEAHVRSKKNISTQIVIHNGAGEVYLIQRPTREQNPSEAYPGKWHSPGVTHGKNELTDPDTFNRLVAREFGGVEFTGAVEMGSPEVKDAERGTYLLRVFLAGIDGAPKNPRGRFFARSEIPWDDLVASHRDVILPTAFGGAPRRS